MATKAASLLDFATFLLTIMNPIIEGRDAEREDANEEDAHEPDSSRTADVTLNASHSCVSTVLTCHLVRISFIEFMLLLCYRWCVHLLLALEHRLSSLRHGVVLRCHERCTHLLLLHRWCCILLRRCLILLRRLHRWRCSILLLLHRWRCVSIHRRLSIWRLW